MLVAMTLLDLPEIRIPFNALLARFFPGEPALVEEAWEELTLDATRLSLEVWQCEKKEVSYVLGAGRPEDWPLMARVHFGVFDLLQTEVPGEHLSELQGLLETTRELDERGVGQDFLAACALEVTPDAALARFLIYQTIRLNLRLETWGEPELEAIGALAELDRRAETIMRERMSQALEMASEGVRPLTLIVNEAVVELYALAADLETELLNREEIEYLEGLTAATALARKLPSADAEILRNEYAERVGAEGRKVESRILAQRHPRLFPSSGAVDTRRSRLCASIEAQKAVSRSKPRVVELLHQTYRGSGS